jgi:CheY-like chemotaxis protein
MDEDIRRGREAGFVEHIVKPVSVARLEEAIRKFAAV